MSKKVDAKTDEAATTGQELYPPKEKSQLGKGQLISKCPFGVFKSPKKPTKFL